MPRSTFYISMAEVLYLHEELLHRFGGLPGLRDLGLLDSALHRPRSGYYQTLCEQAGAMMQSLVMNHPFIDGNKRVAFAATAIFLRLNGYRLVVSVDEGESFIIDRLIQNKAELNEIARWLEERVKPT